MARSKYERNLKDYPGDQQQLDNLSTHLKNWEKAGKQPGKDNTWNVFFREEGRWFMAVIGCDKNGNYNLVTLYSARESYFVKRWVTRTFITPGRSGP